VIESDRTVDLHERRAGARRELEASAGRRRRGDRARRAHPRELVGEVGQPRGTAELAVGRRAQAESLLQPDGARDRVVLRSAQLVVVQAPGGVLVASTDQLGRSKEASDVIGAERRRESL
jgi:hypothetical protein